MDNTKNEWIILTETELLYEGHLLKEKLENSSIPVVVINKRDSAYGGVLGGFIEIRVRQKDYENAKKLILP
jgi:hypothetical protein